jgi:phage shock protein A
MSENLVLRVKRLVSGSANGLVDALENAAPEMVMREAIRELDQAIDDVREELGRATASRYQSNRRLAMTKAKHEELTGKARLAVDQGRDDLAEAAIARQLDFEAQMPVLETAINDAAAKQQDLEGYLAALGGRRREMEADLAAFLAAQQAQDTDAATGSAGVAGAVERRAERAQNAFDRALNGGSGTPGMTTSDRETMAKLAELEKVVRRNSVAERLAAVKATRPAG